MDGDGQPPEAESRVNEKRRRLAQSLERGVSMIHLDARCPGVVVPPGHKGSFHLRLNFSWRYDPPDLTLGEWGVRQTLSFAGMLFKVAVPWRAVFAITGNGGEDQAWMFPEDMPHELIDAVADRIGLGGEEIEQLKEEARCTRCLELPKDPDAHPHAVPCSCEQANELPEDGLKPIGRRGHLKLVR